MLNMIPRTFVISPLIWNPSSFGTKLLKKNIQQIQQAAEQRRKKVNQRSRWADLSMVMFPAFNPDRFLTALYRHTRFIYTAWFTILTLICFAFTAGITITHWDEIGRDTKEFYNFSNKSWGDIFILYALIFAVVVVHEFAHAYVSKHFGSRVTSMGFALIYLTPALFTDTTEAEVMSSRYERLMVTVAGCGRSSWFVRLPPSSGGGLRPIHPCTTGPTSS